MSELFGDFEDLDRLIVDLGQAGPKVEALTRTVVAKTGHDTVAFGQELAPVDTGNLKSTIGVDIIDDGSGFEAGPTAEYGADVEYGTKAHVIRPRNKKALFWPGADHPVAQVNHPGTAPQPYMRPAFEKATADLDDIVAQVGIKALEP